MDALLKLNYVSARESSETTIAGKNLNTHRRGIITCRNASVRLGMPYDELRFKAKVCLKVFLWEETCSASRHPPFSETPAVVGVKQQRVSSVWTHLSFMIWA